MAKSIPFLEFSPQVQQEILDDLPPHEVLTFSELSKRAKATALERRRDIHLLHINIKENIHMQFSFRYGPGKDDGHKNYIFKNSTPDRHHDILPPNVWVPSFRRISEYLMCYDQNAAGEMERFAEHVGAFFHFQQVDFTANQPCEYPTLSYWKTLNFNKFTINGGSTSRSRMEEVLGELRVKELEVHTRVEDGFRWSGPLKMDVLSTILTDWLTIEALKGMECREVHLRRWIPVAHVNALLKHWLAGNLPNLEYFGIRPEEPLTETLDDVMDGIETFQWTERPRTCDIFSKLGEGDRFHNMSNARDIRRSDGSMASVDVSSYRFIFVAWNKVLDR